MEVEMESRVKTLGYKIKGISRESSTQKATNLLDPDLCSHWSTATNTKEWILLELDEPCLLSHIKIYNKSVLEWEISAGLRFKPESFVKVRTRCEAPRREMIYPIDYTPCRYVRISCLRGNPIAIFFIQLIGVSVPGLEPDFQLVVTYLLPQIISHKRDLHDMHLQLLQDITSRLRVFLPQLEADLTGFPDDPEANISFLAMLAGPFYPILHVVNERDTARLLTNTSASETSKSNVVSSALTVSSNFETDHQNLLLFSVVNFVKLEINFSKEDALHTLFPTSLVLFQISFQAQPRRSRSTSTFVSPTSSYTVFRADAVISLLRRAYKDSNLKTVCKLASRILHKLIGPAGVQEMASSSMEPISSVSDESSKSEVSVSVHLVDYSSLFGDEFQISDDAGESDYLNVLDIGAVEEGIFHILYGCATQPQLCSVLAGSTSDFWSALPLVQALLPALRPSASSSDRFDYKFSQWSQPLVLQALFQIVATSSSEVHRQLLHACAGYLASFSESQAKSACVLIDLCSGVLASWVFQAIAKIDLTMELVEDLLGTIQGARHSLARSRAALNYIVLALSGYMDDILAKYKEVKHRILFLLEMLEPFLNLAIIAPNSTISFGDVSSSLGKEEHACNIALNVIRTAVQKSAVLPSLESEWRRGSVAPSILLSVLEPRMQLPPNVDKCKLQVSEITEQESLTVSSSVSTAVHYPGVSSKSGNQDDHSGKIDLLDTAPKMDISEDASLFFAPPELKGLSLASGSGIFDNSSDHSSNELNSHEEKHVDEKTNMTYQIQHGNVLDAGFAAKYFNLYGDYLQLSNYNECDPRASEFCRLALDLHSENEVTLEGHDAAIDALLLAAECYINPFFKMSFRACEIVVKQMTAKGSKLKHNSEMSELRKILKRDAVDLETLSHLERKRDRVVLQILLEAAEMDRTYHNKVSEGEDITYATAGNDEKLINLSPLDLQSADAITLVRQNQALLFTFLIQRLQREHPSMHETLMQSLLLLLQYSTKLYCTPETVIDIILGSAEYLNGVLSSYYHRLSEGNLQLDQEKVHEVQRRWMLLQNMVIASSGGDEGTDLINITSIVRYGKLVAPSAWMHKIPTFSTSASPLVRFIGWMAVSRNADQYLKEPLFLASDLLQLTSILSIFADELVMVDKVVDRVGDVKDGRTGDTYENRSFCVIYPDLNKFIPDMTKQFVKFSEIILEAVGLQLRSVSSTVLPDLLCWFSDLCLMPFFKKDQPSAQNNCNSLKGYRAKNAKAIILYVLEAIVFEHMEAMVPEIPRVVQVLVSLCKVSYCDVPFLASLLRLVKPIISYSLGRISDEEKMLIIDPCLNFESLCFDEIFHNLQHKNGCLTANTSNRALTIFILASVFPDLSFHRRREFLQSLVFWADFSAFEPTTSFHDYLCAFQCVIENCKVLLLQTLKVNGAIPLDIPQLSDISTDGSEDHSEFYLWVLSDLRDDVSSPGLCKKLGRNESNPETLDERIYHIPAEERNQFCGDLEDLVYKLNQSVELCWKFHHQLSKKLTLTSSRCFIYSRCLLSISKISNKDPEDGGKKVSFASTVHWRDGLDGLAEITLILQENHCWEAASVVLDFILGVPQCFWHFNTLSSICSVINTFCSSAPRISWRLQTNKWLPMLIKKGGCSFKEGEAALVDLFSVILGHPEPEQRCIALKHLERLFNGEVSGGLASIHRSRLVSPEFVTSMSEWNLCSVVSGTWDQVTVLASSSPSLLLRTHAMIVLLGYFPYADRQKVQSFLASADSVLRGLGKHTHPNCEGVLLQLSLALIASACLYSPYEDIELIPQNIWTSIDTLAMSNAEGRLGNLEKRACQALCRLRNEGDEAKEVLKEVLSSKVAPQPSHDFQSTRESILQVIAELTCVASYFEIFSEKVNEGVVELEEAEIELDILQKDGVLRETSMEHKEGICLSLSGPYSNYGRLQQMKDTIRSLEISKIREDIISRRQKKDQARHARQKILEEGALREAELLRELDREKMIEVEREIERQHLLELERAKTRELRHNLDLEKERIAQREIQLELEQAESGLRPSRRELSSSIHIRPRDRFRERDNGRSGNEGTIRTSGSNFQSETTHTSSSMPTGVLSGSRQFAGQPPTILQSRDKLDECGSNYDENLDGSKDSGDTGSVGDPEMISALDGQAGGYGSGQRHGSRGSKSSRQIMERKERDGRREGKWERKH